MTQPIVKQMMFNSALQSLKGRKKRFKHRMPEKTLTIALDA